MVRIEAVTTKSGEVLEHVVDLTDWSIGMKTFVPTSVYSQVVQMSANGMLWPFRLEVEEFREHGVVFVIKEA